MGRKAVGPASAFSAAINTEIRAAIGRRRFTQADLAEATGISANRLSKTIYNSDAPLNTNEIEAICSALDLDFLNIISAAQHSLKLSAEPRKTDYAKAAKKEQSKEQDAREEDYL